VLDRVAMVKRRRKRRAKVKKAKAVHHQGFVYLLTNLLACLSD